VARQNVIEDLTAILERLIDDPEQIRLRQERTLDLRDNLLRSWTERIDEEVRRIRWIAR
jgi:protein-arginine kinase